MMGQLASQFESDICTWCATVECVEWCWCVMRGQNRVIRLPGVCQCAADAGSGRRAACSVPD